ECGVPWAMSLRAAHERPRVAFYSGEMSMDRLHERALAIEGRVRVDDLRQGVPNDVARASVAAAEIRMRDGFPRLDVLSTEGVARLAEDVKGARLDLLFVDSLQWLTWGGAAARERV